ncbi:MAG: response regulator, partial [Methylococcus sp.]
MHEQVPGEPPRLLVVDDQPINFKIIARILAEGYAIEYACSGPDALALLEKIPLPDLILLDLVMPVMDGLALCRALKASPRTRGAPILFLTARQDVDSEAEALSAGGVDFIHKPVAPAVLRARVDLHLRLSQRERALRQANHQLRALDDLRQRYEAIVESSSEAILSVDPNGCLNTWNRSAEHLLGYSAREVLGLGCQVLVAKEYR